MKLIIAYLFPAVIAGLAASVAGLGGFRRFRGTGIRLLLPLLTLSAVLALGAGMASRLLVMPTSGVTLWAYGTRNESSSGRQLLVKGTGSGYVEAGEPSPVCGGGWYRDHVDIAARWNGDEAPASPDELTVQVPIGTGRWISFGTSPDGGQVLVQDGEFIASVDTFSLDGNDLRITLPDSSPEELNTLKKHRLTAYLILLAFSQSAMAAGMILLRKRKAGATCRNGSVDLYRFIFSLIILFYHSSRGINKKGYLGVEFFFLLAGWLLLAHFEREPVHSPLCYAKERLWRLYPSYLLRWSLGLIWLIIGGMRMDILKLAGCGAGDLLMLQSTGLQSSVTALDGTAWYMSAMFFASMAIYLMLYLDRRLFLQLGAPVLIFAVLSHAFIRYGHLDLTLQSGIGGIMTSGFWRGLGEMCLGCLLFMGSRRLRELQPKSRLLRAWASVWEAVMVILLLWITLAWRRGESDVLPLLLLILLLVSSMDSGSYLTSALSNPVSSWLGRLSLPVYLSHKMVNNLISALWPTLTTTRLVLLTIAGTLLLSAVFLAVVERITGKLRPVRTGKP